MLLRLYPCIIQWILLSLKLPTYLERVCKRTRDIIFGLEVKSEMGFENAHLRRRFQNTTDSEHTIHKQVDSLVFTTCFGGGGVVGSLKPFDYFFFHHNRSHSAAFRAEHTYWVYENTLCIQITTGRYILRQVGTRTTWWLRFEFIENWNSEEKMCMNIILISTEFAGGRMDNTAVAGSNPVSACAAADGTTIT